MIHSSVFVSSQSETSVLVGSMVSVSEAHSDNPDSDPRSASNSSSIIASQESVSVSSGVPRTASSVDDDSSEGAPSTRTALSS